ncbi:MAG: hypothetical protein JW798_07100, partial [Prolixibacteraceae bacterium]|nr:hypothetical protein [Prolixibacteraceae bacterium]
MKGNIVFSVFVLLSFCFLQSLAENGKGLKQEKTRLYGTIYHFPLGLEGSPYLNDDWQLGDITLVNGEIA